MKSTFKKAGAFVLSLLLAAGLFLPLTVTHADSLYDNVRVCLTTRNATAMRIHATGAYHIAENGTRIEDTEFIVISQSGSISVKVNDMLLYRGSEVNIVPENISREAGFLTLNDRNYLGSFRIRLRDNQNMQIINAVPMAYYLYGVLGGEMSNAFPLEALKAQAIAAKGYVMSKIDDEPNYDIGDSSSEQVYRGYSSSWTNIMEAVDSTIGDVLTMNGKYFMTYYAASNGGETQPPQYRWSGIHPNTCAAYDVAIDEADFSNPNSKRETLLVPYEDHDTLDSNLYALLIAMAQERFPQESDAVTDIISIHSAELNTPTHNDVTRNLTRAAFDMTVELNDADNRRITVDFDTRLFTDYGVFDDTSLDAYWGERSSYGGYNIYHVRFGHGVGLSQRGAQQRANNGESYEEILQFYYPHAKLDDIDLSVPQGGAYNPATPAPQLTEAPTETVPVPTVTPEITVAPTPTLQPVTTPDPGDPFPSVRPDVIATGTVNASGVNLRTGPGLSYAVIVRLGRGTQLDIYDMSDPDWYYVGTSEYIGYMSSHYIDVDNETILSPTPPNITYGIGYINADAVNFRTGPGLSYTSMGRLDRNTRVYIWGTEGEWTHVQIGLRYGYVFSNYVTQTGEYNVGETDGDVWASGETTSSVNLRKGPSTSYEIIAMLAPETQLLIYGEVHGWYDVLANGERGYVSEAYVHIHNVLPEPPEDYQENDAPIGVGYITAEGVNFRAEPSTSSAIIDTLDLNTCITLYSLNDGWYEAEHLGRRGYVYALYVRLENESDTDEPDEPQNPTIEHSGVTLTRAAATGRLNFRRSASLDGAIIEVFNGGTEFFIVGECGDWYYILHNNVSGYVYKAYVAIEQAGTAELIEVDGEWLATRGTTSYAVNLRMGPGLQHSIIMRMPAGSEITIIAQSGEWYLARYGEVYGFAFAAYVEV